jgi:hypothetical protein
VAAANGDLYRHIALYLQVLRSVLQQRVDQACFHLVTRDHGERYLRLGEEERLELHQRLGRLVGRCTSLLTVEQLAALAAQMGRQRRERQRQQQRDLLRQLLRADDETSQPGAVASSEEDTASQRPVVMPHGSLPPGSVQLQMAPPLGDAALQWAFQSPLPFSSLAEAAEPEDPESETGAEELDDPDFEASEAGEDDAVPDGMADPEEGSGFSSELLQALGMAEGELAALFQPGGVSQGELWPSSGPAAAGRSQAPAAAADPEAGDPEAGEGLLPHDPVQLLQWLDAIERALARRLRNLSHAINVDLLRSGISTSLLPASLLEAVVRGQIETQAAPANLVRLQLPFGLKPGGPPLHSQAVLLRVADLEMEEARLRTCRRRLQQHRQELRRMAQQYRRLERRLQAREAERLWLQDIRRSRATPD